MVVKSQPMTPEARMALAESASQSSSGEEMEAFQGLKPPDPKIYVLPKGIGFYEIQIGEQNFYCVNDTHILQMPFYPNGTSSGGSIILMDEKESRIKVSVDPITGGVSFTDEDDEI